MTFAPRPARILVVDDSDSDVQIALRAFSEARLANEVMVARDGAEALDLLLRRGRGDDRPPAPLPDVILLDLEMPGVRGVEVLRRLHEAPALRAIPVVLLASSAEEGRRAVERTAGVGRYLVKPVSFDAFLDAIREVRDAWLMLNVWRPLTRGEGQGNARVAERVEPGRRLRIVLVEDSPTDAELIALRLEQEGIEFEWQRVDTEAAFREAIRAEPDLILSDWTLPRFSGGRALQIREELALDIPFVIVSGRVGEEAAIDALQQGADDYVLKDRLARLGTAIQRSMEVRRARREQARADEERRLAAAWFESITEGVIVTDPDGTILTVNPAFTQITGWEEPEVVGRTPRILKSGRHDESFYRDMWASLVTAGQWRGEVWNRRKDGMTFPAWSTISAVRDDEARVTRFVEVFSDIGEFKKAQADIDFLVHHDALTGLPNRTLLTDRLAQAIRRARTEDTVVGVVVLDVDRFGDVNDVLGHPAGDDVLRTLAGRLGEGLGPDDTLARFGGDDFALVLGAAGSAEHVATRVRELQERVAEPIPVGDTHVVLTASAGISLHPSDGDDPVHLLRDAETALRQTSDSSRNTIGFFEAELAAQFSERVALEQTLRGALARGELEVYFQPQVDLADGRLAGAEALVRWRHPQRGHIPPSVFIPLAEEMGIVGEIGAWVLRESCRQVAAWDDEGLALPRVAVNLSAAQLDEEDLAVRARATLEEVGVGPERLELEVTESMVMGSTATTETVLGELRSIGVEIAMDDFGTGHSSLVQLRRLPLARLKIDLSFVRDIGRDSTAEEIVRAITAMAGGLGLETVAEGVETEEHAAFLRAAGCTLGQGYLWSGPVRAPDLLAAVRSGALQTRP